MPKDIKTHKISTAIKTLDRGVLHAKKHSMRVREKAEEAQKKETPVQYSDRKLTEKRQQTVSSAGYRYSKLKRNIRSIQKQKEEIIHYKNKKTEQKKDIQQKDKTSAETNKWKNRKKGSTKTHSDKIKEDRETGLKIKQENRTVSVLAKEKKTSVALNKTISNPMQTYSKKKHIQQRTGKTLRHGISLEKSVQKSKQVLKKSIKGVGKAARNVRFLYTILSTVFGGFILLLLLIVIIISGIFLTQSGSSASGNIPISQQVLEYKPMIEKYAEEYKISQYTVIIRAIMMQESAGTGNDPMQASECPYNEKYPKQPNGITDPEYSVKTGIKYFSECLQKAECDSPYDMDQLSLALQGYNFGEGYIAWAVENFGGYSQANAEIFSEEQAKQHGWPSYGDVDYVDHVLRYVNSGNMSSTPNFENKEAWGENNPYVRSKLCGQCTWFAWGRFYELYGYSPGFTGNGWDCVNQLLEAHPDKFEKAKTPIAGAVFSGVGRNHVGIVIAVDGERIVIQEGNLDGVTNSCQTAQTDWWTKEYTLQELTSFNQGVVFANPK